MRERGRLARFKGYEPDPSRSGGLASDHPAVVEARTLYPGTVVGTFQSRRFLISGKNSGKIGERIEKGAWAGFPTFTLTLEERATCPRACHMWQDCFGNAMQWARRNDAHDPDFIPALKAEIITLVREVCAPNHVKPHLKPPKGIVIRLHVLGDFYSVAYVRAWAEIMEALPEVHVFGYTARAMMPADGDMSIANEIEALNRRFPDRWVIRWSADAPGPGRTIVVDEDPMRDDVIVCPQEKSKSETCSTCALCWNQNAIDKTIAFIRHGMKTGGAGRPARSRPSTDALHRAMLDLGGPGCLIMNIGLVGLAKESGLPPHTVRKMLRILEERRLVRVVRRGVGKKPAIYQVFGEPQDVMPPMPLIPAPPKKARAPARVGRDPVVKADAKPVRERKPDEPLMVHRPHAHKVGGWGRPQIGTADQYDIGTPEDRIAAVPESELERIKAQYGAVVKKEEPAP